MIINVIDYWLKIASKKLNQISLFHTTALQLLVICISDKEFEANLGYVLLCLNKLFIHLSKRFPCYK